MVPIRLFLVTAIVGVLGIGLSGCGPSYPETFPVSGVVRLAGEPVAGAAVVFTPDEGQQATGTTDSSGRFELSTFRLGDGALPGSHRVTVAKTTVDAGGKTVFLVPQKYGNLQTTPLTCDVLEEMEPVQFDLGAEAGQKKEFPSEANPPAAEGAEPSESSEAPATASE